MVRTGYRKGAKMERFQKNLSNPTRVLKQIGILAIAEFQEAFVLQRLGREAWAPRAVPNRFGIIADFAAGSTPPDRRFDSRPVLKDTAGGGGMSASFGMELGRNTVTIGNSKLYAAAHHLGLEVESEEITEDVQTKLAEWLEGQSAERNQQLGHLLSKRLTGTKLKTKLPKRPLVAITDTLIEDVHEVIGAEIFEIL